MNLFLFVRQYQVQDDADDAAHCRHRNGLQQCSQFACECRQDGEYRGPGHDDWIVNLGVESFETLMIPRWFQGLLRSEDFVAGVTETRQDVTDII